MVVPHVQVTHARKLRHGLAVSLRACEHGCLALLFWKAVVASADLNAGRKSLYIPLPWSRQRLVKVIDVEYGTPLG